jgi:hypothetical protein
MLILGISSKLPPLLLARPRKTMGRRQSPQLVRRGISHSEIARLQARLPSEDYTRYEAFIMSELRPLRTPNHLYSINLDRPNGDPRIYRVRIAGDVNCDFFVGITPAQNARANVKTLIEDYCEKRFERVPRNGEIIEIDLDHGLTRTHR